MTEGGTEKTSFRLINLLGSTVYETILTEQTTVVELPNLASGNYIALIQNEKGVWKEKVVIQK